MSNILNDFSFSKTTKSFCRVNKIESTKGMHKFELIHSKNFEENPPECFAIDSISELRVI